MRLNLIRRMKEGKPLFPGIIGYEKTVIPAIQNALLARHDFILLGLRGQAKTRILRALVDLLDEKVPVVPGSELNDDPLAPISKRGRALIAETGDDAPIGWIAARGALPREARDARRHDRRPHRRHRPDQGGDERRSLSDEEVIHYGIMPRTNRGIFAINELPDLQPRIQVGLLNILEERDLQIRGFPVRIPLDVCSSSRRTPRTTRTAATSSRRSRTASPRRS